MKWYKKPEKKYGGEDYMAKQQRLQKAENHRKEVYKKMSIWKKFKYYMREVVKGK